jgi:hypothetical protein
MPTIYLIEDMVSIVGIGGDDEIPNFDNETSRKAAVGEPTGDIADGEISDPETKDSAPNTKK